MVNATLTGAKHVLVFPISSAVSFSEITAKESKDDTIYFFPKPNEQYKTGAFVDELTLASKDGKDFFLAIAIYDLEGNKITNPFNKAMLTDELNYRMEGF